MDETYWGLTGRPFQLTPDPRFWFETATHRKAMAYLGYGLAQGEGFIVITGDIGAGKTTLVGHLVETLDRQRLDPIRIVSTAIEADDLLRIVAGQLGVEAAGATKAQLLVAIERGLHAAARSGRRTLLVVDEAQALPVSALEELRMLSNFQAGGHALLQIVLLGQPEFRDRLHGSDRLEQLRQRVIAIHHLDPMEEHEVADYLAHRLQVVGWRGRPDFAGDAFEAFYRGSGGVPRRLNLLAGRVMLHAAIERLELIDARVVRTVLRDLHADLPLMALASATEPAGAPLPIVREAADAAPPAADRPAPGREPDRKTPAPIHPRWFVGAATEPPRSPPRPAARGWFQSAPPEEPAAAEPTVVRVEPEQPTEAVADRPTPEIPLDQPAAPEAAKSDLADRLARLETRIDEQDAALRRVLTLLVDWVETDDRPVPAPSAPAQPAPIRGAATWTDAA